MINMLKLNNKMQLIIYNFSPTTPIHDFILGLHFFLFFAFFHPEVVKLEILKFN